MANNFIVSGIDPWLSPAWFRSRPGQKLAYYRVVKELVLIEFDRQLESGLDFAGQPLHALAESTIKHRKSAMGPAVASNPPLTPAGAVSRTRSLVDARLQGNQILVFWRADPITGRPWGNILDYHRTGNSKLPVRNVFGLSTESYQRVMNQAYGWWNAFIRGLPVRAPVRRTTGKPPKQLIATIPAYKPQNPLLHGLKPSKTNQIQLGNNIYTMSSGTNKELFQAIKAGTFSGFRSYE